MTAHRFTKPLGIVVQAGDIVASFHGDLIAYLSLGFDHTKQAQALPGGPIGKIVDLIGGPVPAGLDAAVVFIGGSQTCRPIDPDVVEAPVGRKPDAHDSTAWAD